MIVRRLRLRRLAASERESPSDLRYFAKSAPVMGRCSSAIRRNVVAETSSGPHFVGTGQATPSPPSTRNYQAFAQHLTARTRYGNATRNPFVLAAQTRSRQA